MRSEPQDTGNGPCWPRKPEFGGGHAAPPDAAPPDAAPAGPRPAPPFTDKKKTDHAGKPDF